MSSASNSAQSMSDMLTNEDFAFKQYTDDTLPKTTGEYYSQELVRYWVHLIHQFQQVMNMTTNVAHVQIKDEAQLRKYNEIANVYRTVYSLMICHTLWLYRNYFDLVKDPKKVLIRKEAPVQTLTPCSSFEEGVSDEVNSTESREIQTEDYDHDLLKETEQKLEALQKKYEMKDYELDATLEENSELRKRVTILQAEKAEAHKAKAENEALKKRLAELEKKVDSAKTESKQWVDMMEEDEHEQSCTVAPHAFPDKAAVKHIISSTPMAPLPEQYMKPMYSPYERSEVQVPMYRIFRPNYEAWPVPNLSTFERAKLMDRMFNLYKDKLGLREQTDFCKFDTKNGKLYTGMYIAIGSDSMMTKEYFYQVLSEITGTYQWY